MDKKTIFFRASAILWGISLTINIMDLGTNYINFESIPIINRINLTVALFIAILFPILYLFPKQSSLTKEEVEK